MPGVPPPVIDPRLGTFWTPIVQGAKLQQSKAGALAAGATQGNLVDQYGNTIEVAGTSLAQAVTIGASHGQAGVLVGTGFSAGQGGRVVQSNLVTGTVTLLKGSTTAEIASTASGAWIGGQSIGAAQGIEPGTTYTGTPGDSTITLSSAATASGTFYAAACDWLGLGDLGIPNWIAPTLLNSWANASGGTPAGYYKDPLGIVHLRGRLNGGANGSNLFNLPVGYRPALTTDGDLYGCAAYNGGAAAAFADIYWNGTVGAVQVWYSGTGDIGLGGITFLAEN